MQDSHSTTDRVLPEHSSQAPTPTKDGTFIEILLGKLENYAACPLSYTFGCVTNLRYQFIELYRKS